MSMNLDTKKCLYEYKEMITYKDLDFIPTKNKLDFLKRYDRHDIATEYAIQKYKEHGWDVYSLGVNRRNKKIIVEHDVPDLYLERKFLSNILFFCLEIKTKTKRDYIGWINKRAYDGYNELTKKCKIPIYIGDALFPKNTDVPQEWFWHPIDIEYEETTAWDKNKVCIISKIYQGLPFIDEPIEIYLERKKGENAVINGAVNFNVTLPPKNDTVLLGNVEGGMFIG